jgi:hypothetical protein
MITTYIVIYTCLILVILLGALALLTTSKQFKK